MALVNKIHLAALVVLGFIGGLIALGALSALTSVSYKCNLFTFNAIPPFFESFLMLMPRIHPALNISWCFNLKQCRTAPWE